MKKKIGVVLLMVLFFSSWWYYHAWQKKQVIVQEFDKKITALSKQMHVYSALDLSFLPETIETISFEQKKELTGYVAHLKEQFALALDVYNSETETPYMKELDIEPILSWLSLEQKVAQLLIVWVDWRVLDSAEDVFLRNRQPGGVILMGRNISDDLRALVDSVQQTNTTIPLFVSIDQEWGPVKRIDEALPWQQEVKAENLCAVYQERSRLLSSYGINLNFGIVADVASDAESFIASRTFRGDVAKQVVEAVRCSSGVLSTIKHFPGHGLVQDDTHQWVARFWWTEKERREKHLVPFLSGVEAWVDLVMMGHLLVPFLDAKHPATLSPILHKTLRDIGFSGLIITDDMAMIASNYERKEALKQALVAGNDLLLYVDPAVREEVMDNAIQIVKEWLISPTDLDNHVRIILKKKNEIIRQGVYVPLMLLP